jgi:hypothetical protein
MTKKKDFFWASYADLMTSMFFIMLVLFVLAVVMLKKENSKIKAKLKEFEKIEQIKSSINSINKKYFEYDQRYKKHVFKVEVNYPRGAYYIESLPDKAIIEDIVKAGFEIKKLIDSMAFIDQNIQYLVMIEGQASKDANEWGEPNGWKNNNTLSFLRALHLKKFWAGRNINFDNHKNCELIIAGSGIGGVPRVNTSNESDDSRNQRFLIHIIPKTGTIEE